MPTLEFEVKNKQLAKAGKQRIEWAGKEMPVVGVLTQEFGRQKPLKNIKLAACLHVTAETANLAIALKNGGADVALCASNPLSTQDDVAASLVNDYGISVFAVRGVDRGGYYRHIKKALAIKPAITMDDGADLVSTIHNNGIKSHCPIGGTEETTTGVIRLQAMAREGRLLYPIIAVNNAQTKHYFDNRYGTGQSTLDGIIRATNLLIAGKTMVVCGYGWCGRGVAGRAHGMGGQVVVTEVSPVRALEAAMDGFRVMPLKEAAKIGDIFITVTGDTSVIDTKHFLLMKDGAVVANSGHFDVEINLKALRELSSQVREVKPLVHEYTLKKNKKKIHVLAQGRLVNLACAEGHPSSVMDMSFANQALSAAYLATHGSNLKPDVVDVPKEIDERVARLKLKSLRIEIDRLTAQQQKYLTSWESGT